MLDRQGRFTYVNPRATELLLKAATELLGRNIWEVFPEGAFSTFSPHYHRAEAEWVAVDVEAFYPPINRWVHVRVFPVPEGLAALFRVADAGRGFDARSASATGGRGGLSGMRERARLLGGHLTVESAPGAGTQISAALWLGAPWVAGAPPP